MNKFVIERYYPQFLLLIVAFTFFTRVYRLHIPEGYMFDEVYHAVTAKLILDGDTRAYEWNNPPPEPNTAVDYLHPPYAKLAQAATMMAFGKNSFGWRFSSVIFGCLVVWVTAKISHELFKNKKLALLSAFLVSLDGLLFAMSRIAMNDVHVTFFILLSIWQYIRFINTNRKAKKILIFSCIAAGFALGTKWSGLFAVGFIGISETIFILKHLWKTRKVFNYKKLIFLLKQVVLLFICCLVIPTVIYLGSYSQMFLMGKNFNHLIEMHKNTWWYQTNLTATHPAQSKPIQWFLNTQPVWIWVSYDNWPTQRGDIYAIGNPALFWIGDIAIFVSLLAIVRYKGLKKKNSHDINKLAILIFAYGIVWLPWQLSPRIMFFYHYLPAVPLLTINLSYWLVKIWQIHKLRLLSAIIVLLIFVNFVILYPHLTLISLPTQFKDKVYFFFDFWRQT